MAKHSTSDKIVVGRVDARRNRDKVLQSAARVFAEQGTDVSLNRVAQQAGVGAGTVYRHFPSKEILIEAVLVDQVEGLVAAADRWASRAAPGDALFGFLLEIIEKSTARQRICDALPADRNWPQPTLVAAVQRYHTVLDQLLQNAKRAGEVRADLRARDLAALTVGGAAMVAAHSDRSRSTRLTRQLLDGLRTSRVTEIPQIRDNGSGQRHEIRDRIYDHCLECGTRLRNRSNGRPPRYCGPTCRQRAWRRRSAA